MLVKCQHCGKKIEKKTAYCYVKVTDKKKRNLYFCNEEEYETDLKIKESQKKAKESKNKVYEICCEIYGYKIINSNFWKEYNALNGVLTVDELVEYLSSNKDKLTKIMNRSFDSEFGKIRYFYTVIKNDYTDWANNKPIAEPIKSNVEFYEQKYTPKKRRKPLSFYENEEE